MSEVNGGPELEPQIPLNEQILRIALDGYVTLQEMRESHTRTYGPEHEKPDAKKLDEVLGNFAATHIEELDRIHQLPLPEDAQLALAALSARILREKLDWAAFDQYEKVVASKIDALLAGKVIVATTLKEYGHYTSDGYSLHGGPDNDKVAVGKYVHFDASLGDMTIGEAGKYNQISLVGSDYNSETKTMDEPTVQADIQIFDDLESVPLSQRTLEMAIRLADDNGQARPEVIKRALMLTKYMTTEPAAE